MKRILLTVLVALAATGSAAQAHGLTRAEVRKAVERVGIRDVRLGEAQGFYVTRVSRHSAILHDLGLQVTGLTINGEGESAPFWTAVYVRRLDAHHVEASSDWFRFVTRL